MAGASSNNDDDMITAINVTPLVDVTLVLLIITMVTANFIVSRQIPMDLPTAVGPTDSAPPRTIAISVDQEGRLYLDAEPVTEDQLRSRVQAYVREVGQAEARATIAADSAVNYGVVVRVIDLLRVQTVSHFAINVRPEDLAN